MLKVARFFLIICGLFVIFSTKIIFASCSFMTPGIERITIQLVCPIYDTPYETEAYRCLGDRYYQIDGICPLCGQRHYYVVNYWPHDYWPRDYYFFGGTWYHYWYPRNYWPRYRPYYNPYYGGNRNYPPPIIIPPYRRSWPAPPPIRSPWPPRREMPRGGLPPRQIQPPQMQRPPYSPPPQMQRPSPPPHNNPQGGRGPRRENR